MNYTKPNEKNYVDKPQDYLFCSLVFAAALGTVLKTGEGIFVELSEDEREILPNVKYVIIWNNGKQISIYDASDNPNNLKEGDRVKMISEEDFPKLN